MSKARHVYYFLIFHVYKAQCVNQFDYNDEDNPVSALRTQCKLFWFRINKFIIQVQLSSPLNTQSTQPNSPVHLFFNTHKVSRKARKLPRRRRLDKKIWWKLLRRGKEESRGVVSRNNNNKMGGKKKDLGDKRGHYARVDANSRIKARVFYSSFSRSFFFLFIPRVACIMRYCVRRGYSQNFIVIYVTHCRASRRLMSSFLACTPNRCIIFKVSRWMRLLKI